MTAPLAAPRSARRTLALLVVPLALLVGACGGSSNDGGAAELPTIPASQFEDLTSKTVVQVDAVDNAFEPRYITIKPGTKVEWTNTGRNPHNVVPVEEGQFRAIPVTSFQSGQSATVTFDEPGTYPYYCSLHGTPSRGMNGRIVVVDR